MSLSLRLLQLTTATRPFLASRPHQLALTKRYLGTDSNKDASSLSLPQLSRALQSPVLTRPDIHTYYPVLTAKIRDQNGKPTPQPPLTESQVISILDTLAKSAKPEDLQRIVEILEDLSTLFRIQPTIDMHTVIIRGLIQNGNAHTVFNWLRRMPTLPGHFNPTLEQFHLFLNACSRMESYKFSRHVVSTMQSLGCKPTTETFAILIRTRWECAMEEDKVPHVAALDHIVEDMKRYSLQYDPEIASLLYDCYAASGQETNANQIRSIYEAAFIGARNDKGPEWLNQLSSTSQRRGILPAIELFRGFEKEGCLPGPAVLAILRHSRSLNDLLLAEKELGIKCNASHWSVLISNNIRSRHLNETLDLYYQSKEAGIIPDSGLVGPLIKGLCQSSSISPPTDASLDRAIELYRDLAGAWPQVDQSLKNNGRRHSSGPDINIYHTILRGLSSSSKLEKYYPIATSLIDEMKERGLPAMDSFIATSLIVFLIRRASTAEEAMEGYRQYSSALDERGYSVVLNAFSKLTFDKNSPSPSLPEYFSIVKDMRHAGFPVTVEAYTILLRHLATAGIEVRRLKDPDEAFDKLAKFITATRRTHDLLTLDPSITPDAILFNQLMDTYQRLGCFADAYRVWDMMYISGRYDQVSVSIILDACAYAGALQLAVQIHNKLVRDKFAMDLHNWNTWLECLCRLGRLNEALRTICMDMGNVVDVPPPDVESARIVLKFARKFGKLDVTLARLEQYLPELWKTLPKDLLKP